MKTGEEGVDLVGWPVDRQIKRARFLPSSMGKQPSSPSAASPPLHSLFFCVPLFSFKRSNYSGSYIETISVEMKVK